MVLCSLHREAAAQAQHLTGDVLSAIRGKKCHSVCDVAGARQALQAAPDRIRLEQLGDALFRHVVELLEADLFGIDRTERHDVDVDAVFADFARDGSIVAALSDYDGDLWVAEGALP